MVKGCIFLIFSSVAFAQSAPELSAKFLKLIDRPKVALAPQVRGLPSPEANVTQDYVSVATDTQNRVPMLILKSSAFSGKRPVVIYLHGTGGKKEDALNRLRNLARRGFIGVAMDGRYHGERAATSTGPGNSYMSAIFRAYQTREEHPFVYDTVWDAMRVIDYLETRNDVDPARIGMIGTSKGGMEVYFTAAVDPRVSIAVPMIGVQSFKWALDHSAWDARAWTIRESIEAAAKEAGKGIDAAFMRAFYDRVAPGIHGEFDGPAMVALIAPRPLMIINGDSDTRTPMGGLRQAIASAENAYRSANAPDRLLVNIQENTGHQVTAASEAAAVDWFVKWLKP
jgi:dienelactone hydrolase